MSMERMTLHRTWEEASEDLRNELGYKYIWTRLNKIEDILGDTYDLDRLRELAEADKEGRVQIIPVCKGKECGACQHFKRIHGTKRGKCEVKPYVTSRCVSGEFPFEPSQSRKACKLYKPAFEAAIEKEADHE